VPVPDGQRVGEQRRPAGHAGGGRAGPGEDDEGVDVGGLGAVDLPGLGAEGRRPATVLAVPERPGQRLHAVAGQCRSARPAQHRREAEDVRHPGGQVGLAGAVGTQRPVGGEVPEPAVGVPGTRGEGEQPGQLVGQQRGGPVGGLRHGQAA
jgi:hypothetical protein